MKEQLFMVMDVESIGLFGEAFAVGYVVVNSDGSERGSGLIHCRPSEANGTPTNRSWIEKNVPTLTWEGPVEVFTLRNHPKAKRAFAWSHRNGPNDTGERFVAVLEIPPVDSAHSAVKVAIAHEVRESQKK